MAFLAVTRGEEMLEPTIVTEYAPQQPVMKFQALASQNSQAELSELSLGQKLTVVKAKCVCMSPDGAVETRENGHDAPKAECGLNRETVTLLQEIHDDGALNRVSSERERPTLQTYRIHLPNPRPGPWRSA